MPNKAMKITVGAIGSAFALLWLYELSCGRASFGVMGCALASIALYVSLDAWCEVHPDADTKIARAKHVGKACGERVENTSTE